MQLLAATMAKETTGAEFGAINIAPYLENAKLKLIAYYIDGGIEHPHYVEGYYLLATKVVN